MRLDPKQLRKMKCLVCGKEFVTTPEVRQCGRCKLINEKIYGDDVYGGSELVISNPREEYRE